MFWSPKMPASSSRNWFRASRLSAAMTLALSFGFPAAAHAAEVWRCAYTGSLSNSIVLVQYSAMGNDLIQSSAASAPKNFRIVQDNQFGVIGIIAIAAQMPGEQQPTVSATTVVIEKSTGDFWLTTTIGGQPGSTNLPIHGSCFKP